MKVEARFGQAKHTRAAVFEADALHCHSAHTLRLLTLADRACAQVLFREVQA